MQKQEYKIIIKIVVSIIFIILTIITSFSAGKKFYELKNTIMNSSKKAKINLQLSSFDFDVNFIIGDEVIKIE